jgi:hypothetical protein
MQEICFSVWYVTLNPTLMIFYDLVYVCGFNIQTRIVDNIMYEVNSIDIPQ